jgi:outer membrane protein assembly factor BamB
LLACLLALVAGRSIALAQAQVVEAIDDDEPATTNDTEPKHPFVLPAAKADSIEALEDFRRAVNKGTWEAAFKQVEKLAQDTTAGLVPVKDGLKVPLQVALADELAKLPPAGKAAYRLFHDPQAKILWEQAQHEAGSAELEKLSRLATLELITSVGDLASDRLGEVLFEQGDMTGAVEAWQRVLAHRPDSSLSRGFLLAKVGVALAHAGRWEELATVAQQLAERHADESVVLGGQTVVAAKHIATLLERRGAGATDESSASEDLLLPVDDRAVWQFRFEASHSKQRPRGRRFNPWGMQEAQNLDMVMPAVLNGDSLYANWLGCDFALDLESGKLRWRNGRFHDVEQAMRQGNWFAGDRFAVSARGDQLWLLTNSQQQQQPGGRRMYMQQGADMQLIRRDLATGKERFSSKQSTDLSQYVPFGSLLPEGNLLYLTAHKENQPTELYALAVKVSTGHVQWATPLGTYQFSQQQNGLRSTQPTIRLRGARLYVDSQAGGLVELEAATGKIRWAYAYPSQSAETQQRWYNGVAATTFNPSVPIEDNGLLLVKGMQSPRLTALKLDAPAVAWKRAVPINAMLAGIDKQRIYLAGEEVLAFDRQTQELAWANRLPPGTTWVRPLVTRNRYYQFTPRGVYELDKQTGNVLRLFRGADLDSSGGAILATSKLLITISNHAITAYRLNAATDSAASTVGSAGQ